VQFLLKLWSQRRGGRPTNILIIEGVASERSFYLGGGKGMKWGIKCFTVDGCTWILLMKNNFVSLKRNGRRLAEIEREPIG
jgi:hypothetical protein